MARGWESKGVEQQQNEPVVSKSIPIEDDPEQRRKRDGLLLSRKRVARELDETGSDVRRRNLEAALAHLDKELAKFAS